MTIDAPAASRSHLLLLIVITLVSSTAVTCGREEPAAECRNSITATEAAAIAEDFVRANGYTLHDPDPERFVRQYPESAQMEEVLRRRRGTLNEHPVGLSKDGEEWMVIFPFSWDRKKDGRETGRAVRVDKCGTNPNLDHYEVFLDTATVFLGGDAKN